MGTEKPVAHLGAVAVGVLVARADPAMEKKEVGEVEAAKAAEVAEEKRTVQKSRPSTDQK